jgi:hypothetical protein
MPVQLYAPYGATPSEVPDTKELIITTVQDMVSKFLYYDRKDDEELPRGVIEDAVENDIISVDEIIAAFEKELRARL